MLPKAKKRAPAKRPAKPKALPPAPPKKRSKAFRKAALAASGLATLSVLHIQKLLTAEEMPPPVHGARPGSAAAGYPRTATTLEDDELDELADAFAGMVSGGDAEAPN